MKRRRNNQLKRSQQSIFYYSDMQEVRNDPVLSARPNYYRQSNPYMLNEDVALGIMPIGGRTEKTNLQIALLPSNRKIEEMIATAISEEDYHRDLTEAVCNFIQACSRTIMAFGETIFEIVYLSSPDDDSVVGFELVHIQPQTVMQQRNRLVQYVPAKIAQERQMPQYVELSLERILTFNLPANIRKGFNDMMESLASLDLSLPSFALQLPDDNTKRVPYNSTAHILSEKLALAEASKLIGWNARGSFNREALEYYSIRRQLRFERFKIELRNSILETLNDGLGRVGQKMEFSGRIEISGFPTLADVAEAEVHLSKGDKAFKEILEPFSWHEI